MDFDENAAVGPHLRSVWVDLVSMYGIDVDNHKNLNRDCSIWTRFGRLKSSQRLPGIDT